MPLAGISRATGTSGTQITTVTVVPADTLASGSMGVLVLGTENGGALGNTPVTPTSETDSVGNTWTKRTPNIFADPGNAAQGVELAFYTAPITTPLTTADSLALTLTVGVRQAWSLFEITATGAISYVTGGGVTVTSPTATPTVTTSSIPVGDMVIGGGANEGSDTWSEDADSDNGSWSAKQSTAVGGGISGQGVIGQWKAVTGTGTQTFNPTLTSSDCVVGWIQLHETLSTHSADAGHATGAGQAEWM